MGRAVQVDASSDDGGVGSVARLPEPVAEDRDGRLAVTILLCGEGSAGHQPDAQDLEKAAEPEDAVRLAERGILYAPDYAINAGGVIAVGLGKPGSRPANIIPKVEAIGATLASIFTRSDLEDLPTTVIADRLAGERLTAAASRRSAA
jgi:hypothetical protein